MHAYIIIQEMILYFHYLDNYSNPSVNGQGEENGLSGFRYTILQSCSVAICLVQVTLHQPTQLKSSHFHTVLCLTLCPKLHSQRKKNKKEEKNKNN